MAALKGYFFPRIVVEETSADQAPDRLKSRGSSAAVRDDTLFQVFVLGTRGAGKTVFLASLFHLLSVQDRTRHNFILSCNDPKSLTQLRSTFFQISNPEQDWPAGTFASQEYIFDCEHIKADQRIKLFKFRYFDFPGGFVTENKSEEDVNFVSSQTRGAHSILVLLDGKKIRNLLENRAPPVGEPTIYDDLNMMAGILQQCVDKPLHFAITKSDILNPKAHSLARIKKKLLKHPGFKNLIDQRRDSPVYLLPVSAVGSNFAEFDPASQQMKKRVNGLIEPSYVDMSLTFTLVDYLAMVAAQLNARPSDKEGPIVRKWIWKKLVLVASSSVGLLAGPTVSIGGQALWGTQVDIATQIVISAAATLGLGSALSAGGSRIRAVAQEYMDDWDKVERHFADRQTLLEAILQRQNYLALRFRELYPDARLVSPENVDP